MHRKKMKCIINVKEGDEPEKSIILRKKVSNVSEAIDDVYRSFSQKDTILLENDLPDAFNV